MSSFTNLLQPRIFRRDTKKTVKDERFRWKQKIKNLPFWTHRSRKLGTSHIPNNLRIFQHTPGTYPRPPTNGLCFGIAFIWGFRDSWGMLQGYVGVFLETTQPTSARFTSWLLPVVGPCFTNPSPKSWRCVPSARHMPCAFLGGWRST